MMVQDDDGDEFPVVVDFGLAKLFDRSGYQRGMKLTQTGQVFGTCLYMSHEQCNAAPDLDGRSDMYSFGCVMYKMLTGTPPFIRENFTQTVLAHINEEAQLIEQLVPQEVNPTKLHDTIHKCIRNNPNDRYPSMAEVIEGLSSIMRRGKERSQTMISTTTDSAERKSGPSQAEINFELGRSSKKPSRGIANRQTAE
jgi:serine/threonine-protein kinase